MLYSTILVAFDGSEASERALDSAVKLAKLNHYSSMHVIHVYNVPSYVVGTFAMLPPIADESEQLEYAEQVIQKIKEKIAEPSNVHIEVRSGVIPKEILNYAKEITADVIVIGSRGLGGFGEFMLGSVSHNVVQHAQMPVLIVK